MAVVVMEKVLRSVDVAHRLSFKTAGLRRHFHFEDGVHHTNFEAVDVTDGNIVDLRLRKRRHGHPKPVISRGWMAYVREKGLRVGDKVIIMRVNDDGGEARFSIQAQRTDIMAWGEPFWYDIKTCRCVGDERVRTIAPPLHFCSL